MTAVMQVDETFASGLVAGGLQIPMVGTACRLTVAAPSEPEDQVVPAAEGAAGEAAEIAAEERVTPLRAVQDGERGPRFDRVPARTVPPVASLPVTRPTVIRPVAKAKPAAPVETAPAAPAAPGLGSRLWTAVAGERHEAPVSLTAVSMVGFFALVSAVSAFLLSFQMILPVVEAAGWSGHTAKLGPIVIDVAAVAAALMSVLSQHHAFERTGRLLLVAATGLSIALNLAGHQVKKTEHAAALPAGWDWSVNLFSVTVPLILAWLIHAFGKALQAYLAQQAAEKERQAEEAERQRREAEEAERRAEHERAEQAEAQARRDALMAEADKVTSQPRPKRPRTATKDVAVPLGIKHSATKPSELVAVLREANFKPASESAVKGWCREIRTALESADVVSA